MKWKFSKKKENTNQLTQLTSTSAQTKANSSHRSDQKALVIFDLVNGYCLEGSLELAKPKLNP